ncbi:MAG: hypothetical protein AB1806_06145 [Acidobacteriota bacterium]
MKREPTALVNVLYLSGIASIVVAVWVLSDLSGLRYYTTPLQVRGYDRAHASLKPSGSVAHPLGIVGLAMMTMPLLYAARKKWRRLSRAGSLSAWLEVHVFCGIVGPLLVTFHSSFRFNGIISVAYWSMVAVVLSGFVGRYLYVRIPKSIRGTELTRDEIGARATELTARLRDAGLRDELMQWMRAADVVSWAGRRHLRRRLASAGIEPTLARGLVDASRERSVLTKRLERLHRTKRLFALWHVFHQPLVYLMFAIAGVHIAVALYMGYAWW